MTDTALDIKAKGEDRGARLLTTVARAARLKANQRVRTTVEEGRVRITRQGDRLPTLADHLALFDPAVHGDETMAAAPQGREVW